MFYFFRVVNSLCKILKKSSSYFFDSRSKGYSDNDEENIENKNGRKSKLTSKLSLVTTRSVNIVIFVERSYQWWRRTSTRICESRSSSCTANYYLSNIWESQLSHSTKYHQLFSRYQEMIRFSIRPIENLHDHIHAFLMLYKIINHDGIQ